MINLDDELALEYLAESRELLEAIEADLLAIDKGGPEIAGALPDRACEAAHSVKEGAGFFGFASLHNLAHQTEELMILIRSQKLAPTKPRIQALLGATNSMRELIRNAGKSNQADISGIMTNLTGLSADHVDPVEQPSSAGNLRTLLAEDDFASRLVLQTFLTRYGECHVAVNGREAVDAFRTALERGQRYHLICMDIMMPEMDGREAVRRIREIEEAHGILSNLGAKIILTTAVRDIKEVIRCFRELADAYMVKPIDLAQLLYQMKSHGLVS
jgi:two-component system chemotaxis response regulator CheY